MAKTKNDRRFMERAIEVMRLSKSEHREKSDPLVGAVLVDNAGKELGVACRGQFEDGDHGEFSNLLGLDCLVLNHRLECLDSIGLLHGNAEEVR